ncbi:MAG: hypothetical protein Q9182_003048 [Xanthomendoza sp. 2 TL-2023]
MATIPLQPHPHLDPKPTQLKQQTMLKHVKVKDKDIAPLETASNAYESMTGSSGVSSPASASDAPANSSIYVGNLYFDVKEDDVRREFEKAGTIESVKLIMDGRGLSKGFGYITFTSPEAASNAINMFNQQPFEGRRLTVQYAVQRTPLNRGGQRTQNEPSRTLFIGNMAFDLSDQDLNNLFRGIRNVVDVRVAIDRRTGQPRGFAHADFVDVESAKEAMLELGEKEVNGRRLRVDYSVNSSRPRNTKPGEEAQKGY